MHRPPLFRRRTVWLPTLWGCLLLLSIAVLAVLGLARAAGGFLAVDAPLRTGDGRGARVLVVEGWLDPEELAAAVGVFRRGHYERVVTTGGPIAPRDDPARIGNYALRAEGQLRGLGLANAALVAVPAPPTTRDRTWHSALALHDWARTQAMPLGGIDVFTARLHARRSRIVYRMALGEAVEVGVTGPPNDGIDGTDDIDSAHWWRSSAATKAVLGELLSLAWTECCFWPERPDAH
jgi:hypothetical protein